MSVGIMGRASAHAPETPRIALMYHALHRGRTPDGQDPHYTIGADDFDRHLRYVIAAGGGTSAASHLCAGDGGRVLLTFDDGHASNYTQAFPLLLQHGLRADFFVNPATVGTPGFARWNELREMAEAGMSIQSHGYDHVYLTHLEMRRLRETLFAAREEIEQRIGQSATLLAPPGGRMPANLPAIARECGYTHVLSSRPGLLPARPQSETTLPRMAMTLAVDDDSLNRWIACNRLAIARERMRYRGLTLAKQMMGDAGYERLRARALALLRSGT